MSSKHFLKVKTKVKLRVEVYNSQVGPYLFSKTKSLNCTVSMYGSHKAALISLRVHH